MLNVFLSFSKVPIKIPHQRDTNNWEDNDGKGTSKKVSSRKRKTPSSISTGNKVFWTLILLWNLILQRNS